MSLGERPKPKRANYVFECHESWYVKICGVSYYKPHANIVA